jgi:hypothetical protein
MNRTAIIGVLKMRALPVVMQYRNIQQMEEHHHAGQSKIQWVKSRH